MLLWMIVDGCSLMGVQVSGSTATVAAVTGWEVIIANVGDSCAYLDTGGEVVLVCFSISRLKLASIGLIINWLQMYVILWQILSVF